NWCHQYTEIIPNEKNENKKPRLKYFGQEIYVELTQHHRAIYDAEATAYIFIKMMAQIKRDYGIVNHKDINSSLSNSDSYKRAMPTHVSILVQNNTGLKNLFKIVSL